MGLVFGYRTPRDLLEKVKREEARLRADSAGRPFGELDQDLVFNFIVSAGHIPDWLGRWASNNGGMIAPQDIQALRISLPVQICTEISNADKHFELDLHRSQYKKNPPSASDVVNAKAGLGRAAFGASTFGQSHDTLWIRDANGQTLYEFWPLVKDVIDTFEAFLSSHGL